MATYGKIFTEVVEKGDLTYAQAAAALHIWGVEKGKVYPAAAAARIVSEIVNTVVHVEVVHAEGELEEDNG